MTDSTNANGVTYDLTGPTGIFQTFELQISGSDNPTIDAVNISDIPASNVDVSGDGITNLFSVGSNTYVVPPGVTSNVDIGASGLATNTFYIGGIANIQTGAAFPASGTTLNVTGGTATFGSGLLGGAGDGLTINLSDGGSYSNGIASFTFLNGNTINYGPGGGTFVVNAGGAIFNLSSTTINGFDENNSKNSLQFQGLSESVAQYSISAPSGGNQTINLLDASGNAIGTVSIAGTSLESGAFQADGAGPLTISGLGTTVNVIDVPSVCFLAGSRIRTPTGEVAVEDLNVGDEVVVRVGTGDEIRTIVWTGSANKTVRSGHDGDLSDYPVRILKDAIAAGIPNRDLLVTAEHCFLFEGGLTPIRMLVNGYTIFYDRAYRDYTYYHIELDQHAILYANGMASESYLDTGNRTQFTTQRGVIPLPGQEKSWQHDAAAPLCVNRAIVEPLFHQFSTRTKLLAVSRQDEAPKLTEDADLHLVAEDGRVLRGLFTNEDTAVFTLPSNIRSVRIMSRSARPADIVGPFLDDRRKLGVLVGSVTLLDADIKTIIDTHLVTSDLAGWHGLETAGCRWTNGDALLPLDARQSDTYGTLAVTILSKSVYPMVKQSSLDSFGIKIGVG
jgi:hypothetical protein